MKLMTDLFRDIKINIKHSLNFEIQRVICVAKKAEWYEKMGYRMSLPGGTTLAEIKNLSPKQTKEIVIKEYEKESYEKIKLSIQKEWGENCIGLKAKIIKNGLQPQDVYGLFLTKYGVGGSYELPNKIITNFKTQKIADIPRVIIHEIIHLSIEPIIQKYKTEHWKKERIVDLLFNEVNPHLNRVQNIPINTQKVDASFSRFYPDIEKVIQNS